MSLGGRIGKLEDLYGPGLDVRPTLLTVVENDDGTWRHNGEPVDRDEVLGRRPRLLRVYRLVDEAEGKEPA
jgi:hypothetical protein